MSGIKNKVVILRALFFFLVLVGLVDLAGEPAPPNILIITCDNLGYGDLRSYNPKSLMRTPHLDRFAQEGARLTSFYTASPTCTVSRACLLTGRLPERHGLVNQLPGLEGNYGVGLNPREWLIPQVLKGAPKPYYSGCFGKWNIGFAVGSRPTERGFDEFVGHASGNMDYYSHLYGGKHDLYHGVKELHRQGEYATDIFAEAASEFIRRRSRTGEPWFCYVPFNAPHFPSAKNKRPGQKNEWQAPDWAFREYGFSSEEEDPKKRYMAVGTALDRGIGQVLAAVKESGVGDDTFVFFMSDNGSFRLNREGLDVGVNDPLRSGGVTCWEGGIRVVAMARWPGRIRPNSIIDEPCWSPDVMIASAFLANAALPSEIIFDGKNLLPLLTSGAKTKHESFYFSFRQHAAVRKGDWKIVREHPDEPWELYDLKHDLGEERNLATNEKERLSDLVGEFYRWQRGLIPVEENAH